MNIILFEEQEIERALPISDRRIKHLIKVIKIQPGEMFDAGVLQTSIGKAHYEYLNTKEVKLSYKAATKALLRPFPIRILLGAVRPVNIQRTLRDLSTLGVEQIHLLQSDKSEKSYLNSRAYNRDRILQYLIEGAEQAFSPFLPQVFIHQKLEDAMAANTDSQNFAFDNYDFDMSWGEAILQEKHICMAIGPERGWSNKERILFKEHNYTLCSLGKRVLRTETAAVVTVSVLLNKMNLI